MTALPVPAVPTCRWDRAACALGLSPSGPPSHRRRLRSLPVTRGLWRQVSDSVHAVVDPRYDLDATADGDGLDGPTSPDTRAAAGLRLEAEKQRFAQQARLRSRLTPDDFSRIETDADAEAAAATIRHDGAVFLQGLVSPKTCDAVRAELDVEADAALAIFGNALRRTDVELPFEGATRRFMAEACGVGGVARILARLDDATADATLVELSVLATERGADRQTLHPDQRWDAPHGPLFTLFVALQDIVPAMGPTTFALGTNTEADHDAFPVGGWGPEQLTRLETRTVCVDAVPLARGDGVLYDARTFHQGGENRHGRRGLLAATFLRPPVPPAPTRRNPTARWSIAPDVLALRLTVGEIAAMDTREE